MSTSPRTCVPACQPLHPPQKGLQRGPCAATRLPSCAESFFAQSLVNARVTLVHLEVSSTFQRIGQRGDFYRLPAERIRLRFARFSCTKTAICAMSVNHPHHINPMNHSSDKCQHPSYMRSCLCNPSIRRQRPSSAARTRPARAATRAAFASLPSAGLRPKFLAQSHTISRNLS